MKAETRVPIRISAALGAGDGEEVRRVLERVSGEAPARVVEEALLQAHLFVGFPPVLEAFAAWRRADGTPGSGPDDGRVDRRDPDRVTEDGRATCRRVYGRAYPRLRSNVAGLHPDLDRWMVRDGYGKVLARPGLDLAVRELCIVALLTGARWPRQLHSHLRGALRVGASPASVEAALEEGLEALRRADPGTGDPVGGWERRARDLWARVRDGGDGAESEPRDDSTI